MKAIAMLVAQFFLLPLFLIEVGLCGNDGDKEYEKLVWNSKYNLDGRANFFL